MVLTLKPEKYGKLLTRTMPKRIESDAELERFTEAMETLSRAIARGEAGVEERTLHGLLSTLVKEYDDRIPLPAGDPVEMLRHLMEHRGVRPIDLAPVLGARSTVSLALSGRRELSKAQIRRLAEFFHVSPAVFLG